MLDASIRSHDAKRTIVSVGSGPDEHAFTWTDIEMHTTTYGNSRCRALSLSLCLCLCLCLSLSLSALLSGMSQALALALSLTLLLLLLLSVKSYATVGAKPYMKTRFTVGSQSPLRCHIQLL